MTVLTAESRRFVVHCLRVAADQFAADVKAMQNAASAVNGHGADTTPFAGLAREFETYRRRAVQLAAELEDC